MSSSPGRLLKAQKDDSMEAAFARLPRPQRVLELSRPFVPTKFALAQLQDHTSQTKRPWKKLQSLPPSPPAPPSIPPTLRPPPPLPSTALQSQLSPTSASHGALAARPSSRLGEPARTTPATPAVSSARCGPQASDAYNGVPVDLVTLGSFAQDNVNWSVRMQRGQSTLVMVKQVTRNIGAKEVGILERVKHKNVVKLEYCAWEADVLHIGIEFCRFTLNDVLHVHLSLEERHIQHIACSVFNALGFLTRQGFAHNLVNLKSIRIATPNLKVLLSNFEAATHQNATPRPGDDFVDLGLVLLECMEGRSFSKDKRSIAFVKQERSLNKVFGLSNAGSWSGCKQLIDFLDDLFNENKSSTLKISRPHSFIAAKSEDGDCLRPYIELVTLECFTVWTTGSE